MHGGRSGAEGSGGNLSPKLPHGLSRPKSRSANLLPCGSQQGAVSQAGPTGTRLRVAKAAQSGGSLTSQPCGGRRLA